MPVNAPDDLIITDARQSVHAAGISRGVTRLLKSHGLSSITELPLSDGKRADIAALSKTGQIWIIEIKSSVEDLRADQKWPCYRNHCDLFFFAVARDFPREILPDGAGLIAADKYGGEIIKDAPEHKLSAGRRKAVILRFARASALRLQNLLDPRPA